MTKMVVGHGHWDKLDSRISDKTDPDEDDQQTPWRKKTLQIMSSEN